VPKGQPKTFKDIVAAVKTPKIVVSKESCYPHRPAWRIGLMEMVDPYGWHQIEGDKIREIRAQLAGIEGNTWKELLVRDAKHNHFVAVEKICAEAQERLRMLHLDDTDSLLVMRVGHVERIWGILELNVLKVLWWDPEHVIYLMNVTDN